MKHFLLLINCLVFVVFLSPVTSSAESSPVSFNRVFALDTIPPEPLEFLVPERLEYDLILNYIEYPLFPGCVDFKKDKEKLACSHLRLDNFVYSNLKYPRKAKRKSIEGQVVVEFMVDIDGSIKDAEIIREIGGGCDEEAIRIVENMNNLPVKWIPGKINGTPKKMKCKLFIDFKYKGKKKKKRRSSEDSVIEERGFIFDDLEYPIYPGCADFETQKEQLTCSQEKWDTYVQSNLNYPSEAIKKGVEGQVVVKFIVDVDGTVENIYSLNELGGDCEEEAIRIIENMNNLSEKWTPAKYNGKSIKMANELTIEFYQEREKNKTRGTSEEKGENFSLEAEDPIFPGCGYLENYSKKIGCSHVKLYSYVQSNLKYPEEAIKKGIQGVVNVEYFVNIDGSIKVINIINDIGGGCGKEAKRIIENMNNLPAKWTPAKLRGIPVRFRRTQSIEFKLEDELVVEEEPEYIEVKEDKNEEEIFKMAEQSPRFPGCEDMEGNNSEKLKCAQKRMLEYIYGNLIYPAEAREEVIEGQVVIQFIVERHIHKCPKMLFIS